jgi:hypothetical protein
MSLTSFSTVAIMLTPDIPGLIYLHLQELS